MGCLIALQPVRLLNYFPWGDLSNSRTDRFLVSRFVLSITAYDITRSNKHRRLVRWYVTLLALCRHIKSAQKDQR